MLTRNTKLEKTVANRYINPEDEMTINLSLKVKIKAVGDHSSVGVNVTQQNYDFVKDNGDLVEYIKEEILSKIPYQGEINLDFIDRIIYEIID